MDDLALVLEAEVSEYKKLISLSEAMKDAIIVSDLTKVTETTGKQEAVTNDIQSLETKRIRIMKEMAIVMNVDPSKLKVSDLEKTLTKQPELKDRLAKVRAELKKTMEELNRINSMNQVLIHQAMDFIEFDLNLLRSTKQAPETANYNRNAYNTGELLGGSGFDAKQ